MIKEDNVFRINSILRKKKNGKGTWESSIVGLMRETSTMYKKNIKVAIAHFPSNRDGPNTGVLYDITEQQFYADISNKYLDKFYYTTSKFTLDGDWEVGLAEIQYPYTWNIIRSGKKQDLH